MADIYKAIVPGSNHILPYQFTANSIIGWERVGRVEDIGQEQRYGRVYGTDEQGQELVGIVKITTLGNEPNYGVVFRIPPFIRRADYSRKFYDFTLGGTAPKSVTGFIVGFIDSASDGLELYQGEDWSGRHLGYVSNKGTVYVFSNDGSMMGKLVQCGYISPAINTWMMAGAALLQVFDLGM